MRHLIPNQATHYSRMQETHEAQTCPWTRKAHSHRKAIKHNQRHMKTCYIHPEVEGHGKERPQHRSHTHHRRKEQGRDRQSLGEGERRTLRRNITTTPQQNTLKTQPRGLEHQTLPPELIMYANVRRTLM